MRWGVLFPQLQHSMEKVRKGRLSKPMLNFLMSAKKKAKIGKIQGENW